MFFHSMSYHMVIALSQSNLPSQSIWVSTCDKLLVKGRTTTEMGVEFAQDARSSLCPTKPKRGGKRTGKDLTDARYPSHNMSITNQVWVGQGGNSKGKGIGRGMDFCLAMGHNLNCCIGNCECMFFHICKGNYGISKTWQQT